VDSMPPLQSLLDSERGSAIALPPRLAGLIGRFALPLHPRRSTVIGNFVSTLDGVVALDGEGKSGGGEISGFNAHDRLVMRLLRALADVVIIGAGTLRASSQHLWTAAYIFPALADEYQLLRASQAKATAPLNAVVNGRGEVDLNLPVFQTPAVPALIVTTARGLRRLNARALPAGVEAVAAEGETALSARAILEAVSRKRPGAVTLVEGGPALLGDFLGERCLDELFLTLAPQIAGRDASIERPGLVEGRLMAPQHPLWSTLVGVKRGGSHLFLRYAFE
jgi:riboflavin biosynthesis pyrimidine reductase